MRFSQSAALTVLVALFAVLPTARADNWNKKTYLTVNDPIEIPGGKVGLAQFLQDFQFLRMELQGAFQIGYGMAVFAQGHKGLCPSVKGFRIHPG